MWRCMTTDLGRSQKTNLDLESTKAKTCPDSPEDFFCLGPVVVPVYVGFAVEAPDTSVSGFCVYHRNRLIKPFWKVYTSASSVGRGVIGFLQVDFVEPAHDKQV